MNPSLGFFAPWILTLLVLVLQLAIPARKVAGYVRDSRTGKPLTYRINGVFVFIVVVLLWSIAGSMDVMSFDWLWKHRWNTLAGALALGILVTACAIWRAPKQGKNWLSGFFFGRRFNPQLIGNRVDVKMFLYLFGAIFLQLNLLSFTAHHVMLYQPVISPGVLLYLLLFTWFICDYLVFEHVHLYTYDLVAENVGFKLIGGCLVFYPFFYGIGLWAVADLPSPRSPWWLLTISAILFFAGWVFARGSNLQKYHFKKNPKQSFLGVIQPTTLTDGTQSLLCSGFWRISRHVNYLGEFLMAIGLTLSVGYPLVLVVWLYPIYYVLLLVARERDDDRRCALKYGALWDQYRSQVPSRIIPGVY